ncbi:CGI-121-domain-containing protein [Polychaeton citri CBS 116435]|uniref:EKC/KEOPS complex subunit CGI121 n=1 Tax=Polychaeton citri CBS 116435 TaxID=1314669 RepID=A0A9P4USX1_9PEZI|nr:CGI-121-domain-containing protein [Polychaeton citri CBS 116435]
METVDIPHLAGHSLEMGLFIDVKNAAFLRQQLLSGNQDFEYAFLDASVLLTRNHILAACWRAIVDLNLDRLRSKNVHSEIVFSLSTNNNIAESFRKFGVQDETKNLVVIKVIPFKDSQEIIANVRKHITSAVEGEVTPVKDEALARCNDAAKLRKAYKLESPKKGTDETLWRQEAESFAIGSMALKGS